MFLISNEFVTQSLLDRQMTRLPTRQVARTVVIDAHASVLLVRYEDGLSTGRSYWVPPGGALEVGETHRDAAQRELTEETGLIAEVGEELWTREFRLELANGRVLQKERYFAVRLDTKEPFVANHCSENIAELKWWPYRDLQSSDDVFYPEGFKEELARILPTEAV